MAVRLTAWVGTCALAVWVCAVAARVPGHAAPQSRPTGEDRVAGGSLRMLSEAPKSLDPADGDSVYESLPLNQIFNGLVVLDPSLNVLPSLASSWTISRDGRIYTLRLRSGVTFHDGSTLTAEDVVFTFRRLLTPVRGQRNIVCSYLQNIEGAGAFSAGRTGELPGVAAMDSLTVRIRLQRPYYSFLQVLAMDGLKIVPKAFLERRGDAVFDRSPVGTGPFRLAEWDEDHLSLAANQEFFGHKPSLDRVDIYFFRPGETDSGTGRFDRGEIDVLEVPGEDLDRLSHNPGVRIHRYQELSLSFLGISCTAGPLRDVRIRQAIAQALDRETLVKDAPRHRRAASSILPPGLHGYSPRPKTLPFDRDGTRILLEKAGHPGGRGLPAVDLFCNASKTASVRTARRIQSDLREVGVPVRIQAVPWHELSRRIDEQTAPLFLLSWVADLADPDSFLRTLFESEGSSNFFRFHDDVTEGLLAQGERELNPVVRAEIYRRSETRILEIAPLVPLYHPISHLAVRAGIHGLEPGPLGISNVNLGKVWLTREGPGS